jgi:hypothetical protein
MVQPFSIIDDIHYSSSLVTRFAMLVVHQHQADRGGADGEEHKALKLGAELRGVADARQALGGAIIDEEAAAAG